MRDPAGATSAAGSRLRTPSDNFGGGPRRDRRRKPDVGLLAVLADVETFDFLFLAHAETDRVLDCQPEDRGHRKRVDTHRDHPLQLRHEKRHPTAVEEPVTGCRTGNLVYREQTDAERPE